MFKGSNILVLFVQICLVGCIQTQSTKANQKPGYASHIVIMPDQKCPEKTGRRALLKEQVAHKNAKICYYN